VAQDWEAGGGAAARRGSFALYLAADIVRLLVTDLLDRFIPTFSITVLR
jgi:hypothetical protein